MFSLLVLVLVPIDKLVLVVLLVLVSIVLLVLLRVIVVVVSSVCFIVPLICTCISVVTVPSVLHSVRCRLSSCLCVTLESAYIATPELFHQAYISYSEIIR